MDETQPITGPTGTPPADAAAHHAVRRSPEPGAPSQPTAAPRPLRPRPAEPLRRPAEPVRRSAEPLPAAAEPLPAAGLLRPVRRRPAPTAHSTYGAYPPGYGAGLPDQPSATTAMVLGIIGLVGIAFCGGLTLVLSPFAWAIGRKSVREIDANPGRYGGRDKANAGKIMGIIGTVLLVIGIVAHHRASSP